ncbi:MAG: hypothetical protein U1E06_08380 [Tabrizicola sp.]|jgi:lambda repressor-like predicted transcriptional regulator|nr:hypothetical protein [Tabrizicola sp.]
MKSDATAYARPSKITVPKHAHPAAKIVFAEMHRQGVTYDELEWKSGVQRTTFKAWRHTSAPGLETLSAALGALGWELLPCPPLDALAPAVRRGIQALADEHGIDEDAVLTALLREVAHRPLQTRRPRVAKRVAA